MSKYKRIYTFRYGRILYYLDKAPMMITIAYLRQHQVWPMKLRFFFGFCCPQGKKMWWGCCPQWVKKFLKQHSHFYKFSKILNTSIFTFISSPCITGISPSSKRRNQNKISHRGIWLMQLSPMNQSSEKQGPSVRRQLWNLSRFLMHSSFKWKSDCLFSCLFLLSVLNLGLFYMVANLLKSSIPHLGNWLVDCYSTKRQCNINNKVSSFHSYFILTYSI